MSLKAVRAADARAVVRAMETDGAVRIGPLFPPALLGRMRDAVLRRVRSGELERKGLVRDVGGRYAAVVPLEGPFLDPRFYANPSLTRALGALLGPGFVLSSLETVVARPGAGRQHQHVDGPMRFDRLLGGRKVPYRGDLSKLPPYAVSLYVPMCDVTEENGPTAVWAGSHKAALSPRPPGEAAVGRRYRLERMEGPLGSAFLFDYRVFHGGMPNWSRDPRPLLIAVFTRPWYRDPNQNEVFPSLALSPRDYARIPDRHKPLFMLAPAARRRLWPDR